MEIVFLLVILGFSVLFLVQTHSYQVPTYDTSGGPAMFPQYILIMLIAAIVILVVQLIIKRQGAKFVFGEMFTGVRGIFFVSLVVYLALLRPIGFLLSTALFLLVTVNFLARVYKGSLGTAKEIVVRSSISLGVALFVNFLFADVFRIMLPTGTIYP